MAPRPRSSSARGLVRSTAAASTLLGCIAWWAGACGGGGGAATGDGGVEGGFDGSADVQISAPDGGADVEVRDAARGADAGVDARYPDAPGGDAVLVPVGTPAIDLTTLDAGLPPFAIVVADFNGDHVDDVAVSTGTPTWDSFDQTAPGNADPSSTLVLLGKGDGTLGAASLVLAAQRLSPLLEGDLNGDQKADLIAGGQVLLGRGDGTFAAAATQPAPGCVGALGDVDGDGVLDLAGYDSHGEAVDGGDAGAARRGSICLGNGDGTFKAPVSFASAALAPTAIALGDLTGDGKADVVVAQDSSSGAAGLSVLVSTGMGALGAEQPIASATFAPADLVMLVLADVTGDGKLDLAASCPGGASGLPTVAVLAGAGDGTFATAVPIAAPMALNASTGRPSTVAAADVNGDGHPDLLFGSADDPLLWIALAATPASARPFAIPFVTLAPTPSPSAAAVGQLTGDTVADLVVLRGRGLAVVPAATAGVFEPPSQGYLAPAGTLALGLGDVNGDGLSDFVLAGGASASGVTVYASTASGRYLVPPLVLSTATATNPAAVVADFNGDHLQDVAIAEASGVGVFLGRGNATFGSELLTSSAATGALLVADLNGDHVEDLVVGTTQGALALLGKGNGTFNVGSAVSSALTGPGLYAVGDVNGDGRVDVLVVQSTTLAQVGSTTSFSFSLGQGDGTFAALPITMIDGVNVAAVALVDINDDHFLDLVLSANVDGAQPDVQLFLGAGNATFTQAPAASLELNDPGAAGPIVLGDFRGTGHVDLAAGAGPGGGIFALLPGNGDGSYASPVAVGLLRAPTGGAPRLLAAGSFAQGQVAPAVALEGPGATLAFGLRRPGP